MKQKNPTVRRDVCGEDRGYARHRRANEVPCDSCREAHRLSNDKNKADRLARERLGLPSRKGGTQPKPIEHGTIRGYHQHWRRKRNDPEHEPCTECVAAKARDVAEQREKAKLKPIPEEKQVRRRTVTPTVKITADLFAQMYWSITDQKVLMMMDYELGKERVDEMAARVDQ